MNKLCPLLFVFALLLIFSVAPARAAGFKSDKVPAEAGQPPIPLMIWSPCAKPAAPVAMGLFTVRGVKDCAIEGTTLPLIVISHGHGGDLMGHHDTAVALADAGNLVVSFNHPGDTFGDDASAHQLAVFESRPRDVSRVIDYMLDKWSQRNVVDRGAIGVFGFSRGGYTALAVAGAKPSTTASSQRFCAPWWSFAIGLCRQLKSQDAKIMPKADPRVRAVVSADPLNLFDGAGVSGMRVPVLLMASEIGGEGVKLEHVDAIRTALAPMPEFLVAKGAGHFAFLAPCTEQAKKSAAALCEDPKGFDRDAWHREINQATIRFFARHLRGSVPPPAAATAPAPTRSRF